MIEPLESSFDDRDGFRLAVLTVLAQTRRELLMADPDFQSWPLTSAEGAQAFKQALMRGAHARVLVAKPGWLERYGDRFHRLRRVYADRIALRSVPEHLRFNESLLLADRQHMARRIHPERFKGQLLIGIAPQVEPRATVFDALWAESVDCLPPTTLGL